MGGVIASLFKIAEFSLSIYKTDQARIYLDRIIYLKKAYYYEQNKPPEMRNHAIMDNAINELCIIVDTFAQFGEPIPKN